MKDRPLSKAEFRRLVRQVEREEGVKFPANTKLRYYGEMQDERDYARFEAFFTQKGQARSVRINVYRGLPTAVDVVPVKHELREAAGVIKGKRVSVAHKYAMRKEKGDLRSLPEPYRTPSGKPYSKTLPLLRKVQRQPRTRLTPWQKFLRSVGFGE